MGVPNPTLCRESPLRGKCAGPSCQHGDGVSAKEVVEPRSVPHESGAAFCLAVRGARAIGGYGRWSVDAGKSRCGCRCRWCVRLEAREFGCIPEHDAATGALQKVGDVGVRFGASHDDLLEGTRAADGAAKSRRGFVVHGEKIRPARPWVPASGDGAQLLYARLRGGWRIWWRRMQRCYMAPIPHGEGSSCFDNIQRRGCRSSAFVHHGKGWADRRFTELNARGFEWCGKTAVP